MAAVALANGQGGGVKVLKSPQPDDSALKDAFIDDRVPVEMTVDGDGRPFALQAAGGLPDDAVRALEEWRFEPLPGKQAFNVKTAIQVRRPITPEVEADMTKPWHAADTDVADALKRADSLTADQAAALRRELTEAEAPSFDRTTLLTYYARHSTEPGAKEARAEMICWLIQHYPEADVLGSPYAVINASGEALADPGLQKQAVDLWEGALTRDPGNYLLAQHAVNLLQIANPGRAIKVLAQFADRKGERAAVGRVFALSVLGVSTLDPATGRPLIGAAHLNASSNGFQGILKNSVAELVIAGLAAFVKGEAALAEKQGGPAEEFAAMCESWRAHAKELYPGLTTNCDLHALPATPDRGRIHVGEARLKKRTQPQYPTEAKSRRVQGTVTFSAVVDKTARVTDLELQGGPLPLYEAARSAVMTWVFEPLTFNGHPIEFATTVTLNFTMSR